MTPANTVSKTTENLAHKVSLESQIAAARDAELSDAVQRVRAIVAEFRLTEDDVFAAGKAKARFGAWYQGCGEVPRPGLRRDLDRPGQGTEVDCRQGSHAVRGVRPKKFLIL